eukprot:TRINITY_DN1061_c0_g2_i1.p1 TRINITY_DN1061_c0_g2~~TRINITY_DN1061_c0_g2_i1.p1  ORF type:complete len:292 (-),score=120.21 TRINITY_DN1061_c0_g2_i1:101-976(-)
MDEILIDCESIIDISNPIDTLNQNQLSSFPSQQIPENLKSLFPQELKDSINNLTIVDYDKVIEQLQKTLNQFFDAHTNLFYKRVPLHSPIDKRMSYEGEIVDGKPHGFGRAFFADGNYAYIGYWKNGSRHGNGLTFKAADSLNCKYGSYLYYQGEFENGKLNGFGATFAPLRYIFHIRYIGIWKDSDRHGNGFLYSNTWQDPISFGFFSDINDQLEQNVQPIPKRRIRSFNNQVVLQIPIGSPKSKGVEIHQLKFLNKPSWAKIRAEKKKEKNQKEIEQIMEQLKQLTINN